MTPQIPEKYCHRCDTTKPLTEFYVGDGAQGRRGTCKACCYLAKKKGGKVPASTLERKLEKMKGKTYMYITGFRKKVTGYTITEEFVTIHAQASLGRFRPVTYPLKGALNKINKEFQIIQR